MNKIFSFQTMIVTWVSPFELIQTGSFLNKIFQSYNGFRMLTQTFNQNFEETLFETASRPAFYLLWIVNYCNGFRISFKHRIITDRL